MKCDNCSHVSHPGGTCNTKGCECAENAPVEASAEEIAAFAVADAPPADAPAEDVSATPTAGETAFTIPVMVLEGVDTSDGRFIQPGATTWRTPPITLMGLDVTGFGHDGAIAVGRIETLETVDASAMIDARTGNAYGAGCNAVKATGFYLNTEEGQKFAQYVEDKAVTGISIDAGDVESEIEVTEVDDDGFPIAIKETVTAIRIMGATQCPFPAFEGAYITLGDGASTEPSQPTAEQQAASIRIVAGAGRRCEPCEAGRPLVASAGPLAPPRSWFEDPHFAEPTPLTITKDGRIFGHLAEWGTCHTGVTNTCVVAPKSRSGYAHYRLKAVETAEGDLVPVGTITMGTGHASTRGNLTAEAVIAHYDNTGTAVADVAAGEDEFGIWFAGAMRPDVTETQVRTLRASAISGDWRARGGYLELLAALAVNVPGFPITRAVAASGAAVALVAAGVTPALKREHADLATITSLAERIERMELRERMRRIRS